MASPIQNLIGIGAAGATPVVYANNLARSSSASVVQNNTALQQIVATQAAQIVTQPGKKRVTNDQELVDPAFDSEEKEAKAEKNDQESEVPIKRKHDGSLDIVA